MKALGNTNSLSVNLIADPWEWPCSIPLSRWKRKRKYLSFKFRLHWSLLWHHEVQILDTFPLFNPDFEYYFNEQETNPGSEAAFIGLMGPSDQGGLRIALRKPKKSSSAFKKLQDVDKKHVHGNESFIWYPGGEIPSPSFAKKLDTYLQLPSASYDTSYMIGDHCEQMHQAFLAAFHRTDGLVDIYNEFSDVREELMLRPGWFEEFEKVIENRWRRSTVYRLLGWGLDGKGQPLQPHRSAECLALDVRSRLRQLADASYHMAIDSDLKMPSRFPGERPPMNLLPLFHHGYGSIVANEDDADIDFANSTLLSKGAGLACIEGRVDLLLAGVRDLTVDRIYNLRGREVFLEYRNLYAKFAAQEQWSDSKLMSEITRQVRGCMKEIGKACGVPITDSKTQRALVAFARCSLTSTATTISLAIITKSLLAGLAKPVVDSFFNIASITQPVGTRKNPARYRIKEAGSFRNALSVVLGSSQSPTIVKT